MQQLAEKLMDRKLSERDGLAEEAIVAAEKRLNTTLPTALREIYLHAGKVPMLMDAFQHFYTPKDLKLESGCLVFMEENQGVILWGIKEHDLDNEDPEVFQVNPDDLTETYSEEKPLSEFLRIILYYQAAQGGYPYGGWLYDYKTTLPVIKKRWDNVVSDNGLNIWWQPGKIIFQLEGDEFNFLTASAQSKELLHEIVKEYGFEPEE